MKTSHLISLALASVLFTSCSSMRHPKSTVTSAQSDAAFARLKSLAGTWEGTHENHEGKLEKSTVVYEVASGGNVVEEKLFKGTPHEMLSVYYREGNDLMFTHYCMLPNRPHLALTAVKGDTLEFDLHDNTGLTSPTEQHIHQLTMKFVSPTEIHQDWTGYENGEKKTMTSLDWKKVR